MSAEEALDLELIDRILEERAPTDAAPPAA